jgi:hypothetical protein
MKPEHNLQNERHNKVKQRWTLKEQSATEIKITIVVMS